jgi:class 3 adenylate cyclase
MHREFRKRLEEARGESRAIVAVFFDIREFSAFNTTVEAVDAAAYIKRIYQRVLDDYFAKASFFKPTGDGLMIIYDYDATTVQDTVRFIVHSSLKLIADFGQLASGDPMVNFEVPKRAGVGIARGSACCLISNGKILDYSGRLLNLAARLMDLARPEGIVMDGALGVDLLEQPQQARFEATNVIVRGIAERSPGIPVLTLRDLTVIPESAHRALDEIVWIDQKEEFAALKLIRVDMPFRVRLQQAPKAGTVTVAISRRDARALATRPHGQIRSGLRPDEYEYDVDGNVHFIRVFGKAIAERLMKNGARLGDPIRLQITYQPTQ